MRLDQLPPTACAPADDAEIYAPRRLRATILALERKLLGARRRLDTAVMRARANLLGISVGRGTSFLGSAILAPGSGSIRLGARVSVVSRSDGTALGVARPTIFRCLSSQSVIEIGDDTGLSGTVICASQRVTIGSRCLIGADVTIFDTDFHPHEPNGRRYATPDWERISAPVTIGDDVFLGTGVVVQKGVTIGAGSVVAARSVVVKDLPPMCVAGGNPARILRRLEGEGYGS